MLNTYENFIFDLDGTLYKGDEVIESAVGFVNRLISYNKNVLFLTNNSTNSVELVKRKLQKMNYHVKSENIVTSSMIALEYSQQIKVKNPYIVGESGLKNNFNFNKNKKVDAVICGLDRKFNYDKLDSAVDYIRQGANFIATNTDKLLPTDKGYSPGAGTIVESIKYATNIEPIVVGKPSKICIDYLIRKNNIRQSNTIFIGDNLLTDIKQADDYGYDSIFVTTGVHNIDDIFKLQVKPKYISESLSLKEIKKYEN